MYKNYLTVAWRNLLRNKVFSLINILGLAIGMTACFLILQYVHFELGYDRFHDNSNRLYRVTIDRVQSTSRSLIAANHPGIGPALKTEFPEVLEYSRMLHQSIIMGGDVTAWSHTDDAGNLKVFNEERVYDVDPAFLTMFSFPFVYGHSASCLDDKNSVVISESVSRKFFGPENPLGNVLHLDGRRPFTITGVFKDIPENSHFQFDILVAAFVNERFGTISDSPAQWKWPEFYTYILLDERANIAEFEAKIPAFTLKYMGERMKEMQFEERMVLQPVADIHLKSPAMTKERVVHGNSRAVYFLLVIGVLILVIAWINYINLSSSKSVERTQEVGMRKVSGASKAQLISQFLFESALVNLFSILLSFAIVGFAWPYFKQLAGKNISDRLIDSGLVSEPLFWVALIGVFIIGSFLAGLYPAFVLSSLKIVSVLKGKFFGSRSGIVMRKTLVVFQFIVSVALIAGTAIVYRQVSFMRNQDLGYKSEQLLVVKAPKVADSTALDKMHILKTELKKNPNINSIASTSEVPGKLIAQSHWIWNMEDGPGSKLLAYHLYIDNDFLETYGIRLLAGRNFTEDENFQVDNERVTPMPVILNEKGIAMIGFKSPEEAAGQLFYFGFAGKDNWVGEIVGVVDNHHQRSLKDGYDPIIFFPFKNYFGQYLTLNVNMVNPSESVAFVKDEYDRFFPGNQFEYFFLDDHFNTQYEADQQFGRVFGLFSSLAVIVAALGLFGLSIFMITQRRREIAIRKVLGATIPGMVYLFSLDFIILIALANVIALPLVYIGAQNWLNTFAFQAHISWLIFIIPALILLMISLFTVSLQTIKTGSTNLLKSLRTE